MATHDHNPNGGGFFDWECQLYGDAFPNIAGRVRAGDCGPAEGAVALRSELSRLIAPILKRCGVSTSEADDLLHDLCVELRERAAAGYSREKAGRLFVCGVARKLAWKLMRSNKRFRGRAASDLADFDQASPREHDAAAWIALTDLVERVSTYASHLSPKLRQAMLVSFEVLRDAEEFDETHVRNIYVNRHRALQKLREWLNGDDLLHP
ncbi:MAG: hypothetical protein SF069_11120 [Phycisphaerae bacterium]|nr:hypothetical protein [Phycisphaerae bacterium]